MEINTEIADDIMCNAIEVGIAYWFNYEASKTEFTKYGFNDEVGVTDWRYLAVQFEADIDGARKHYSVTAEDLVRVFPAFADKYPHLGECYADGEYNGDATSDDALFQFACFGEIVFG